MNADDLPPEKLMMAGRRWSASGGPYSSRLSVRGCNGSCRGRWRGASWRNICTPVWWTCASMSASMLEPRNQRW